MDRQQTDSRSIAAEAVGQRPESATPAVVKEEMRKAPDTAVPQAGAPAGPQASVAEKAAEAMGERAGDAYPDMTMAEAQRRSREAAMHAQSYASTVSRWVDQQPLAIAAAAFGVGYAAAFLIHRRQ
jgi:hypothetical protein